jgi:hypothetical protein
MVHSFNNWKKLNEQKLRNELVRNAGTGDKFGRVTGDDGFDQKSAYDDIRNSTKDGLEHMFKRLSKDPDAANAFIRKISKHVSIEDIAQSMHDAIINSNPGSQNIDYITTFGDDDNGSPWLGKDGRETDSSEYEDEFEIDDYTAYQDSPYTNDNWEGNGGEAMFNQYRKRGPLRVRSKRK